MSITVGMTIFAFHCTEKMKTDVKGIIAFVFKYILLSYENTINGGFQKVITSKKYEYVLVFNKQHTSIHNLNI